MQAGGHGEDWQVHRGAVEGAHAVEVVGEVPRLEDERRRDCCPARGGTVVPLGEIEARAREPGAREVVERRVLGGLDPVELVPLVRGRGVARVLERGPSTEVYSSIAPPSSSPRPHDTDANAMPFDSSSKARPAAAAWFVIFGISVMESSVRKALSRSTSPSVISPGAKTARMLAIAAIGQTFAPRNGSAKDVTPPLDPRHARDLPNGPAAVLTRSSCEIGGAVSPSWPATPSISTRPAEPAAAALPVEVPGGAAPPRSSRHR